MIFVSVFDLSVDSIGQTTQAPITTKNAMFFTVVLAVVLCTAGASAQIDYYPFGDFPSQCSVACENDVLNIRCWREMNLHVDHVFWGSWNSAPYNNYTRGGYIGGGGNIVGGGLYRGYNCGWGYGNCYNPKLEDAKNAVMDSCEGQTKCEVNVTRDALGNPCKYDGSSAYLLKVCYSCAVGKGGESRRRSKGKHDKKGTTVATTTRKPRPKCKELGDDENSNVKRNGKSMTLHCDVDESINIRIAIFGKKKKKCSRSTLHIENKASRKKTFKTVYNECQGWRNCTIPIKPKHFGRRKARKLTYLQVVYTCSDIELRNIDGGFAKCSGKNRIFFQGAISYQPCPQNMMKTCERKKKCPLGACQANYSCQKPRKYKRDSIDGGDDGDGGDGGDGGDDGDGGDGGVDGDDGDDGDNSDGGGRKKIKRRRKKGKKHEDGGDSDESDSDGSDSEGSDSEENSGSIENHYFEPAKFPPVLPYVTVKPGQLQCSYTLVNLKVYPSDPRCPPYMLCLRDPKTQQCKGVNSATGVAGSNGTDSAVKGKKRVVGGGKKNAVEGKPRRGRRKKRVAGRST